MFRHLAGETEQELRLQAELLQLAASGRGSMEEDRRQFFYNVDQVPWRRRGRARDGRSHKIGSMQQKE